MGTLLRLTLKKQITVWTCQAAFSVGAQISQVI